VPPYQFVEGGLGIVPGKFPHQVHVIRIGHHRIIPANVKSGQTILDYF
jgi:hypothetical protein